MFKDYDFVLIECVCFLFSGNCEFSRNPGGFYWVRPSFKGFERGVGVGGGGGGVGGGGGGGGVGGLGVCSISEV